MVPFRHAALAALALVVGLSVASAAAASGDAATVEATKANASAAPRATTAKPSHKKSIHVKHKKRHHAPAPAHAATPTSGLAFAMPAGKLTRAEALFDDARLPAVTDGDCPREMAMIDGRFCIDRWEASLVEVGGGVERPFSPFSLVEDHEVRAVSVKGVFPQGYVSGSQAQAACARSGKRLCSTMEWRKACVGPEPKLYGYADAREHGRCNDAGRSPMLAVWGPSGLSEASDWSPLKMNDPRLNQLEGSLSRTGAHDGCTNDYGVYDMVGNLHEWTSDPDGTFQGGYYLDTSINGEGCSYRTTAHDFEYHDYSTGFRCCADTR
jgi:hypothetical protein